MSRKALVAGLGAVLFVVAMQCGAPTGEASLSISAKPRSIANDGQAATLTLNATDELGKPGTGTVHVVSAKGSLKAGADVTLKDGTGTVDFTCAIASDPDCTGSVAISGKWTAGKKDIEASVNVTVTLPMDGGMGIKDGGTDGGTADAGQNGPRVFSARAGLVTGTGDNMEIFAVTGPLTAPTPNVAVTFTTSAGSFTPQPGSVTTTATTAADGGPAVVTLFVADAPRGPITVTGSTSGGTGSTRVNASSISNITHFPSAATKTALGTSTSGRDTSTQVFFKVVDSSLVGVPGVGVTYKLDSQPNGATVAPFSLTDDAGIAVTTLQAGIGVGTATIRATVAATADAGMVADTVHPGTPIVLGAPTFTGFSFTCKKANLGALHTTGALPPTRPNVTTECNARLADGLTNNVAFKTSVQFSAEIGVIDGPIEAIPTASGTIATTQYSATSSTLPLDVAPIAGEPDLGNGRNPRDMTVTLIAVVAGAEEFWDGSGASNGKQNGKWDPGEWYIDLSEPFVDANDNDKYDPGERALWDAARLNCATGQVEPANGKWDGPNGCYDSNTQLWRSTHIQLSGPMTGPLVFFPQAPPWVIPGGDPSRRFTFRISDLWGSPSSPEQASMSLSQSGMNVGTTKLTVDLGGQNPGMTFHYDNVVGTETSAGSNVFTYGAKCSETAPAPSSPLTRCVHHVTVDTFTAGNYGSIDVDSRMAGTLSDGGVRPVSSGLNTLTIAHEYSQPVLRTFTINYE